jgi:transposase
LEDGMIPCCLIRSATGAVMMGRQTVDQSQLFYLFNLEEHIPADHLLRRLNPIVTRVLVDLGEKLAPFYSDIGRRSIAPELMIRMLIVGYCYGTRFERNCARR